MRFQESYGVKSVNIEPKENGPKVLDVQGVSGSSPLASTTSKDLEAVRLQGLFLFACLSSFGWDYWILRTDLRTNFLKRSCE